MTCLIVEVLDGAGMRSWSHTSLLGHRQTEIDLGLQGPINKNRILEQSQVIF